ncbi:MAG: hypothetical protein Q9220_001536 [cf. Caloplaca sp. 1 TL-2023]
MYSAFDTLYPHIPGSFSPPQRKRSHGFLASVKGLVKRPSRSKLDTPSSDDRALPSRSTSALGPRRRQRSHSPIPRIQAHSWGGSGSKGQRHRENVPSMIDYLTLAQLENVWYKQDSYKGCVSTPQAAPDVDMQEIQLRQSDRDSPSLDNHPALRARGSSFDEPTWSRPPSYRP